MLMVERTVHVFGGIRVDTTDWPVVLQEFPGERIPDPVGRKCLAYLEKLMREAIAAREKSYHVFDLTRVRHMPTATQLKDAADFVTRTSALAKAASLGSAYVTPSSFLRGLLTAISRLTPSPVPSAFFATRDEAYLDAVRALEAGGVILPRRLVELRDGRQR